MAEPLTFEAWWENHKHIYDVAPSIIDEGVLDCIKTSAFLAYHHGQEIGVNKMLKQWKEERGL